MDEDFNASAEKNDFLTLMHLIESEQLVFSKLLQQGDFSAEERKIILQTLNARQHYEMAADAQKHWDGAKLDQHILHHMVKDSGLLKQRSKAGPLEDIIDLTHKNFD